jgi:hypothetical protein
VAGLHRGHGRSRKVVIIPACATPASVVELMVVSSTRGSCEADRCVPRRRHRGRLDLAGASATDAAAEETPFRATRLVRESP